MICTICTNHVLCIMFWFCGKNILPYDFFSLKNVSFFIRNQSGGGDDDVEPKRARTDSADVYYRMNVVIKSTHFIQQEISEGN